MAEKMICARGRCNNKEIIPTNQYIIFRYQGKIKKADKRFNNIYLCKKCYDQFNSYSNTRFKDDKIKSDINAVKLPSGKIICLSDDNSKFANNYLFAKKKSGTLEGFFDK